MKRPRLAAELPAGLAAFSLRLHGGAHCRPPISRMGNKAGYAASILGALGLRSGQGADAYLWAEADPDVAAILAQFPGARITTSTSRRRLTPRQSVATPSQNTPQSPPPTA